MNKAGGFKANAALLRLIMCVRTMPGFFLCKQILKEIFIRLLSSASFHYYAEEVDGAQ